MLLNIFNYLPTNNYNVSLVTYNLIISEYWSGVLYKKQ